jgi:hypothetical protein
MHARSPSAAYKEIQGYSYSYLKVQASLPDVHPLEVERDLLLEAEGGGGVVDVGQGGAPRDLERILGHPAVARALVGLLAARRERLRLWYTAVTEAVTESRYSERIWTFMVVYTWPPRCRPRPGTPPRCPKTTPAPVITNTSRLNKPLRILGLCVWAGSAVACELVRLLAARRERLRLGIKDRYRSR